MVSSVPDDEHSGLPYENQYAKEIKDLDLCEKLDISEENLILEAKEAEEASLSHKGITNSEGASRSWKKVTTTLVSSEGFEGTYSKSTNSLSVIAIAGSGMKMERDYEYAVSLHSKDLRKPKLIGEKAAKRAVARLGSKKVRSCKLDVVFSPRIGNSLLSALSSCISGDMISRGTSFLKESMGKNVFRDNINITNDPHKLRGLRSRPFDEEGVKNSKIDLIKNGKLNNLLLDIRNSRKLKMEHKGNPSPTNLSMHNGSDSPENIISNIKKGLYVTEMMGMSFNHITGDYSRGASGFLIEKGKISHPVSEVTIAGNMSEIFQNLTPANNLKFRTGIDVPTILVENMTLAGL